MTYLIERNYKSGIEIIGSPENTRRSIVDAVRSEPGNVLRILELGEPDSMGNVSGRWRDITEDIAQEVFAQCCEDQERPSWELLNFLQRHDAAPVSLEAAE